MATSSNANTALVELKVSAHLMTFEAGMFCVYTAPGSAPVDAADGLPGVRISHAPASLGMPGKVSLTGFNADGWLGGQEDATLLRISDGPAQVLITVYQAKDTKHPAPELKVVRLTEPSAPPIAPPVAPQAAPKQAEPQPASPPAVKAAIEVGAHIYGVGDVGGRLGDWMGERGSKRWIEGFGMAPESGIAASDIEYQAVLGRGWLSPWAEGGQFCGSRGMSLPILGLRVRLKGAAAETHTATVEATFVDGSVAGPVTDGAACESPSLAALEAFRVVLEKRVRKANPARGRVMTASPAPKVQAAKVAAAKVTPAQAATPKATGTKATGTKATGTKATGAKATGAKPAANVAVQSKAAPAKATPIKAQASKPASPKALPPKSAAKPKRTPATTRRR